MIMMIILRFGSLLVVFYDDFPSHIEKKCIFILTFACLATPFLMARYPPGDPDPQVGNPALNYTGTIKSKTAIS